MDTFESIGSFRGGEKIKVSISSEHNGGVHEESRHHFRLHEKAVLRPHRPTLSSHGTKQKVWSCK